MQKYFMLFFIGLLCAGCASTKPQIKATSANQEVVIAEGMSPIVSGDLNGAKKTSLHEAMKNALGLVIGVYVSQEALVSKAVLIEDNITSQTEGYIEKYDVLNESHDENFYKTKIKALIRKEDLSAKLKSLELEPKKLGNPIVVISIEESIDGAPSNSKLAENELKNSFTEKGFIVSDSTKSADILVVGKADSNFNTDEGLGGMISYRANSSIKTYKTGSQDVISANSETSGGIDVSKDAAAKASLVNSAKRIGAELPSAVLKYLKERSTVNLTVSNIENINKLNDLTKAVRALIEVRDCFVRNYSDGTAIIDLDMKKGTASDVAKRLEQMSSFKIKVKSAGAFNIEAELIK